jgi:hypothetical protein
MNISTNISAASNGAYQLRTRQDALQNATAPLAPLASKQAGRDASAIASRFDLPVTASAARSRDTVELSSKAVSTPVRAAAALAAKAALPSSRAAAVLDILLPPDEPGQAQSSGVTPSYSMDDLEGLLSVFGSTYDLGGSDNADPMAVRYDLNGDGIVDADDLNTLLNLIQ